VLNAIVHWISALHAVEFRITQNILLFPSKLKAGVKAFEAEPVSLHQKSRQEVRLSRYTHQNIEAAVLGSALKSEVVIMLLVPLNCADCHNFHDTYDILVSVQLFTQSESLEFQSIFQYAIKSVNNILYILSDYKTKVNP
jgi:Holliday junction resolvasome RuvABC endonuclease subunit